MTSLAEYERELMQDSRARERTWGRPKRYTDKTISKLLVMRLL